MHYLRGYKEAVIVGASGYPVAITSDAGGASVDLLQGDGQCIATLVTGAKSGTSPTLDVKIQESDDASTWTDVSGAAFTQIADAASQLQTISFIRGKRYVRAYYDVGGTSPSFVAAVLISQQRKMLVP